MTKKILIVEDEWPLLKVLTDEFEREKFTVLQAHDGVEGLESALKNNPDLILLDIIMPKMDGIMMLKKLREDERGKDVPVIILTNLNDSETAGEALKNRAYDYLVKADWRIEDLIKKVKERLNVVI